MSLDARTLAARCVYDCPIDVGATPYVGIRAERDPGDPLPPFEPTVARTAEEARTELRRALERATLHAMGGARRVAVMTGGGVDSAALLALAHRVGRERGVSVFAATMDFGGAGDDRPYLEQLERHLGCEVVRVRPEDAAAQTALLRSGVDAAPFTWPGGPLEVETFRRAKQHGAERVLFGVGGDELFDGEPYALGRALHRGIRRAFVAARALRGFGSPRRPVVSWVVRPFLGQLLPWSVQVWRSRRGAAQWTPAWAGPVLLSHIAAHQERREATARRLVEERRRSPRLARRVWGPDHHEHVRWLMHQEALAAEIELRTPFLEASLRDLVFGFDPIHLLHGGIRRGLFREAVRDLLPQALVDREDKAEFGEAFARVFAESGGPSAFRDLATMRELDALGIVRAAAFGPAFERFARGEDGGEGYTWLVPALAVEGFVRAHRRAMLS